MLSFIITGRELLPTVGTPDIVIKTSDFDAFQKNVDVFAKEFPDKIFGCVEDPEGEYELNAKIQVPDGTNDATGLILIFTNKVHEKL